MKNLLKCSLPCFEYLEIWWTRQPVGWWHAFVYTPYTLIIAEALFLLKTEFDQIFCFNCSNAIFPSFLPKHENID